MTQSRVKAFKIVTDRLTDDADDIVICSFSRERAWRSGML